LNSQLPTINFLSKTCSATQHFHRVSADSNVGDLLAFACRAHKDFTRPPSFDPLADENLLVRFCQPMPHHPTHGTPGRCSGGRIFSAIEKPPGAHFDPAFAV